MKKSKSTHLAGGGGGGYSIFGVGFMKNISRALILISLVSGYSQMNNLAHALRKCSGDNDCPSMQFCDWGTCHKIRPGGGGMCTEPTDLVRPQSLMNIEDQSSANINQFLETGENIESLSLENLQSVASEYSQLLREGAGDGLPAPARPRREKGGRPSMQIPD